MGSISILGDAAYVDGVPVDKGAVRNLNHEIDAEVTANSNDITALESGKADAAHVHPAATISVNGFLSAADKAKLDAIEAGAQTNDVTSVAGRTGAVVLATADVAGLDAALSAKAPLASPHLTGVPLAPTAAADTNSDQIATCTFVLAQGYIKSSAPPTLTLNGDVTGTGTSTITTTLVTVLGAPGTFQGLTLDAKGRVIDAIDAGYATVAYVDAAAGAAPEYSDPERDRPENNLAFSSELVGADRDAIGNGFAAVNATLGAVWRLEGGDAVGGYQDIAPIQETAVEAARTYRCRVSFARTVDPVDPSGHAVELRIQNLTQNRAAISDALVHSFGGLVIADGVQDFELTFSRVAGADYTNPATTRYAVPHLRLYGGDHNTDIAVIEVEDVTDATTAAGDSTAAIAAEEAARIAADEALQEAIDAEEAARIAADQLLGQPATLIDTGRAPLPRSTLRLPATSSLLFGTLEVTTDSAGQLVQTIAADGTITSAADRQHYPSQAAIQPSPAFGAIDSTGRFVGITSDGEVEAQIRRAYSIMGRAPAMPQAPDLGRVYTNRDGYAISGEANSGAPYLYAARPDVVTEWLSAAGAVVAPFTAAARECIVAYIPGIGRRVLTPYSAYHFIGPTLAYGDKCVVAWRYADGASRATATAFAVSIDGSGDMVPEDPSKVYVLLMSGQSLAVGSHGEDEYPWINNAWPDHTLVLDNTTIPGDVRLGRDADDIAYLLGAGTLGAFRPISPRAGNPVNLGFTPLEGFAYALQAKIVRKFGRPQRIAVANLGVAGAAIADLDVGSATRTNMGTAINGIVAAATARGWTADFAAYLWIQGESNGTTDTATYRALFEAEVADVRALCLAASGTQPKCVIWSWSSFGEDADNETTSLGGLLGQMLAYKASPSTIALVGPHYPLQSYYFDWVHFLAGGYLRIGERACAAMLHQVWGDGVGAEPLYPLSAVYNGAGPVTVTITWSRPIQRDTTLVPIRSNDGIEIAYGSGLFATISSHVITPGSATSVVTLSAALTAPQLAAATLQVGLVGQATPRTAAAVPGTNIRAVDPFDYSEYDGRPIYHWACHDRIALT